MKTESPPARLFDRNTPPHVATLVLIAGLAALSMNVFLPSLPGMAVWFGVPYATMQLSVPLYLALSGTLQLMVGPLSDRFGRRPVLLWSIGIFLAATVGTILAPSAEVFLFCRMAQASIATGFVLGRAIVRDLVSGDRAASMIGYVTMGMSIIPMVGPVIGGALDAAFGWQANFGLLLVVGGAILALVWSDLGETTRTRQSSMREQFRLYPVLLKSGRFWGYAIAAASAGGAFFSYLGGAPYVGAEVFGMSSAEVGVYFAFPAIGYGIGNFISGRFSVRFGSGRIIVAGALVLGIGLGVLVLLSLGGMATPLIFFGLISCVGLGNGMTLPGLSSAMMSVRPDLAGTASGLGGVISIGGGAALAAIAGRLLVPGSSELPLLLLMFAYSVVSLAVVLRMNSRSSRFEG
jgi:DHA1 family bicyclomycin/chloramphenicol resistance-like MFS transporter